MLARGFSQKEGINSEETLTPGSKVHFLQNYHGSCFHDEVKTSLLNGMIEEEFYIE